MRKSTMPSRFRKHHQSVAERPFVAVNRAEPPVPLLPPAKRARRTPPGDLATEAGPTSSAAPEPPTSSAVSTPPDGPPPLGNTVPRPSVREVGSRLVASGGCAAPDEVATDDVGSASAPPTSFASSTPAESPPPPDPTSQSSATEAESCQVGSGGCVAHALTKLVDVGKSVTAMKRALDGLIEPTFDRLREGSPTIERERAGVEGETWHTLAIRQACLDKGFHFHKVKLEGGGLVTAISNGRSLLVDGVLNVEYEGAGGHVYEIDPTDEGPRPWEDRGRWRHAVAIVDGVLLEQKAQKIPATHMWLDPSTGVPDRRRGSLLEVLKAWRVEKCTGEGSCTGECMAP